MANANSGSMMMVVLLLLGAALSSSLAGGVGWYGYDQGWFGSTGGSIGASGDTMTAAPADDAKDAAKSKKNVPVGTTVYIYNARCKGADGGKVYKLLSLRGDSKDDVRMFCRKEGDLTSWTLEESGQYYHRIKSKDTKKYLCDDNGALKMSDKKDARSDWLFVAQDLNTAEMAIINRESRRTIDVDGENCGSDATKLQLYAAPADKHNVSGGSRWKIRKGSLGASGLFKAGESCLN